MDEFAAKAQRLANLIEEEMASDDEVEAVEAKKEEPKKKPVVAAEPEVESEAASEDDEAEPEEPPPSYDKASLVVAPPVLQGKSVENESSSSSASSLGNPNVAMLFLKADKTAETATWSEAFVDHTVQFGQPYPAITHCEMWVGERASRPGDDNHFSTYLGAKNGAMWTSGLADSERFYGCSKPAEGVLTRRTARSSWSAIPIFALEGAEKLRRECNLHHGTPYPPAFLLWQYPMSTWPLRAFSGLVDDRINSPAHCAALSARILRTALPKTHAMAHPSHWYGPSSLYLELATPMRMEEALARERPVVKAKVEEEALDRLADVLVQHSDDEVVAMRREDAHKALHTLAINVLRAGSRVNGNEVDQDDFRDAQERYARGLCRYTWTHRRGGEA